MVGMITKPALAVLMLGVSIFGAEKKDSDKPEKPQKPQRVQRGKGVRRAVILVVPVQSQTAILRGAVAGQAGAFIGATIINVISGAVEARNARRAAALAGDGGEADRHEAAAQSFLEQERLRERAREAERERALSLP
jgi:hypothetical protein